MSNAAIFFDPEPYDATMSRPMGRNSAGEGFLRGFLKYADVDEIHLWNVFGRPQADLEAMVESLGPPSRPVVWIDRPDRAALARAGGLHIPSPELQDEACLVPHEPFLGDTVADAKAIRDRTDEDLTTSR